jgi:hypothetical protein
MQILILVLLLTLLLPLTLITFVSDRIAAGDFEIAFGVVGQQTSGICESAMMCRTVNTSANSRSRAAA